MTESKRRMPEGFNPLFGRYVTALKEIEDAIRARKVASAPGQRAIRKRDRALRDLARLLGRLPGEDPQDALYRHLDRYVEGTLDRFRRGELPRGGTGEGTPPDDR